MANWFTQAFGGIADAVGGGIADARDKIIFGGFFNLNTTERNNASDLGWFQDHSSASARAEDNALDKFYNSLSPAERSEHFCEPPAQDHGIER